MSRVYRAHDTKLNEEVALKLIKPEIAAKRLFYAKDEKIRTRPASMSMRP